MSAPAHYSSPPSLDRVQRAFLGLVGIGLGCLWGAAAWLSPSPEGFGTHQGLGLPPCTIVQWTGTRCPSCGMTTSWAWLIRGRPDRSAQANFGGFLLGLAALASCPFTLVTAWRGRWWGFVPDERRMILVLLGIITITLIDWAVRRWLVGG